MRETYKRTADSASLPYQRQVLTFDIELLHSAAGCEVSDLTSGCSLVARDGAARLRGRPLEPGIEPGRLFAVGSDQIVTASLPM